MLSLSATFACSFSAGAAPSFAATGARVGTMMSDAELRSFLESKAGVSPKFIGKVIETCEEEVRTRIMLRMKRLIGIQPLAICLLHR